MHPLTTFDQNLVVAATSFVAAVAYVILGVRKLRCDPPYARAFLVTAFVGFALAFVVLFQVVSPVVGYSLLCLDLAGFQFVGLLQDEHARAHQRRIALLAPRPSAEIIPTVWITLAAASVLMVAPYLILDEQRTAATIVAVCTLLMSGIAWRIASAPRQLYGENLEYERIHDRCSRTRKAGITAVIAMGSIMVFIAFVNYDLNTGLPLLRTLQTVSWWTWALSGLSLIVYCVCLGRQSSSAA